jgi:endonuclease G
MRRVLWFIALFALFTTSFAWDQRTPLPQDSCKVHSPYGFAQTTKPVQPICREGYFVAYDAPVKIPVYVAYTLEPKNALGCFPRTNAFVADKSITDGAKPDDYVGTGYDKGHAAPDGDLSWSQQVEWESFLMTNMYPQAGSLNRGIWKLLETSVRGWSVQLNNPYTVYVGALYGAGDKTIGKSSVIVPHGYYKIVINNTTREAAGWFFPHVAPYPNLGNDLTKFRKPIKEIQQDVGVTFAFPLVYKELAVGQEWKVDFGQLTKDKRAKCGANAEV